jgi:hypothetical protein
MGVFPDPQRGRARAGYPAPGSGPHGQLAGHQRRCGGIKDRSRPSDEQPFARGSQATSDSCRARSGRWMVRLVARSSGAPSDRLGNETDGFSDQQRGRRDMARLCHFRSGQGYPRARRRSARTARAACERPHQGLCSGLTTADRSVARTSDLEHSWDKGCDRFNSWRLDLTKSKRRRHEPRR